MRLKQITKEAYDNGYEDGLLKGSEVGDATANRFLKERDEDMSRLGKERLEWMKELTQARARIEALEGVLKTAREEIEQSIKDRFWAMNKEYLAKEHIENSSVLKLIDRALSALDAGEKG